MRKQSKIKKLSGVITTILAFSLITLTACGNENEINSSSSDKTTQTDQIVEKDSLSKGKGRTEEKTLTENWTKESNLSKHKAFRLPFLNEEVFGDLAKDFNQETEKNYQLAEDCYAQVQNTAPPEIDYFVYEDKKTNTYSLVSERFTINGEKIYTTFVVDIDTKKKLSFNDVLKRVELTKDEVREQMTEFYRAIYASASYDNLMEMGIDTEMEDYLQERLNYFDNSIEEEGADLINPTLFAIEDGNLNLYTTIRFAGYGELFYRPFFIRKSAFQSALLNGNPNALIAKINELKDPESLLEGNLVATLDTEATGEILHFIALKDHVNFKIVRIEYSEKTADFLEDAPIYEKVLNRGDIVKLNTIIPEGIPFLRIYADYKRTDEQTKEEQILIHRSELDFNGRFKDPAIEYLDGQVLTE